MSDRNANFHQRHSIRLKGYDYSKAGLYFITLCVQHRECLFGEIVTSTMVLNDAGKMIVKWFAELENKFPYIRCHEMVVMPNHFHCIIEITGEYEHHHQDAHAGAPLRGRPDTNPQNESNPVPKYGPHNKKYNPMIGDVVGWFKTMTTNEYIRGVNELGWKRFDDKLWQRNYWEHIIRDDQSYDRIAAYIIQNPEKWDDDQLNQ